MSAPHAPARDAAPSSPDEPGGTQADPSARLRTWLLGAVAFVLVGWALHATAAVTVLIAFSLFLSLMLWPLVVAVRRRVPEVLGWLGHAAAMLTLIAVAAVFVGGLWLCAQQVLGAFPAAGTGLSGVVPGMGSHVGPDADTGPDADPGPSASGGPDAGGAATTPGEAEAGRGRGSDGGGVSLTEALSDFAGVGEDLAGRLTDFVTGTATAVLDAAVGTLTGAVVVFFLTLLMLIDAPGWRRRLSRVLDPEGRRGVFGSAAGIGRQVRRYLLVRAAMGALTAALYAGWLWVAGIDLLLVWALLAFLLSFVPNLGSVVSGLLPTIYAFATRDVGTALLAGGGLLAIEQVIGNFVDPRLMGRVVSISPLVILVALLAWGWVWGAPGLLLAVPMTISVMIVCAHVEPLRPVALLLSDRSALDEVDEMLSR